MIDPVTALSVSLRQMNGPQSTQMTNAAHTAQAAGQTAPGFANAMADVAAGAIDVMKKGEAAAISGIEGKMSTQRVVEAVMQSELTLQTAMAIRNKAVSAYQEISRMHI